MSACGVCGRERFVKGGEPWPEPVDDAKHCLAWFHINDSEACYRLGYARLESELREAGAALEGMKGERDAEREIAQGWERKHEDAESALSAERTARVEALDVVRDLMGFVEDGSLVRCTARDDEPDWAMRSMRLVAALARAARLILLPPEGHPRAAEVKNEG